MEGRSIKLGRSNQRKLDAQEYSLAPTRGTDPSLPETQSKASKSIIGCSDREDCEDNLKYRLLNFMQNQKYESEVNTRQTKI